MTRRTHPKSGTIGGVNPERAFSQWATRYPTRYEKHLMSRGRVSHTRDAWAVAHQVAGDGVKQAAA